MRSEPVSFRVSEETEKMLHEAAERANVTVSELLHCFVVVRLAFPDCFRGC